MTIDEVIQRENKIAKENQKIVDTQIVFDDVYISELYCDDTEVIEEHLSNYKKCAEYHEQIAEWLEDYKHIKQWKSDVMDDFCRYDVSSFEELIANARNKAIDDFATKICEVLEEYQTGFNMVSMANTGDEKLDYAYEKVGNALDKAIEIVKQEAEQYNNVLYSNNRKGN